MRRRRWSASCGLEIWSRLADREHGLYEDELQVLCPWGEGDLEADSEQWRLGALLRNGGDNWRLRGDRRDCRWDAGDRWRGNKDGCPASNLVMPASKRPTRGSRAIPGPAVMDHGDVVQVSGISEEDESAETAHYLQMNWTHGEHGDCQTVSVWREETGVWSGKRSQKTFGAVWPGPDVSQ